MMNLTADVKPLQGLLATPYCESSFLAPREAPCPSPVREKDGNQRSVDTEIQLYKVVKSEDGESSCAMSKQKAERREEVGCPTTRKEAPDAAYVSTESAPSCLVKVESQLGGRLSHPCLEIPRPPERFGPQLRDNVTDPYFESSQPQHTGASRKELSRKEPEENVHLAKRPERFESQIRDRATDPYLERSPHLQPNAVSYKGPEQNGHFAKSCNVQLSPSSPARIHPPQYPTQELPHPLAPEPGRVHRSEIWCMSRPMHPAYGALPWYANRHAHLRMNGQTSPSKTSSMYGEECCRPFGVGDVDRRRKHSISAGTLNYLSSYDTANHSLRRDVELSNDRYRTRTTSGQHTRDYNTAEWMQKHKPPAHRRFSEDAQAPKDSRLQHSVSLCRNDQAVAYTGGGYNRFAEDLGRTQSLRCSPVIVGCYSLADTSFTTADSAPSNERAKSPGVPSMAFYDDRIHHRTAQVSRTSQSVSVLASPRDAAKVPLEEATNAQSPRGQSSLKTEMSCHVAFYTSVDGRRGSRDEWSRAWKAVDSRGAQRGEPDQSAVSPTYTCSPHVTKCDETATSSAVFPEQRDQGLSAPVHQRTSPERMTSQAKQMATQREEEFVRAAAVHASGRPIWSRKRHSYPDNQPRSSKTAKPPTFSRFSPDLTQPRRQDGSHTSSLDDSARADSARERYGTGPRAHPTADQPQPQHQIRITSQGGVISVENMPGQNRSSGPMTACEKPKSPQAPQGETTNGRPGRETGETGQSTSAVGDEIPDLSEYARAFNITDIDERDLDEGIGVSEDGGNSHDGEPKTNASGHVVCPCNNPFCCGSLSRNRLDKLLGSGKREKRFPCRFCGRRFAHLSTLQNHVRVHTGDRPYQCKYCGKCFAQSGVLKTHLRTHTGDKPFQCPFCGRFFAQSTTLTNHLRIHTGHKPFVCKHCSKAFSQPSTLRKHEISHTDQRPYPCKVCGRAFVQQSTLNNHMRSHTGQKPYKCPFCGRGFAQLSTMDRHLKIHTSFRYKPHQCPYCDKDFSYLSNLTNHLQTHNQPLAVLS